MKKNISIEYTHDVVAFKNKHRLCLPTGFSPQVIESETHLLELARSLEKLGHLYGKKHEPTSDFPHRDLIVLEYADVEESSRYKLLDARREKEKSGQQSNDTGICQGKHRCLHLTCSAVQSLFLS